MAGAPVANMTSAYGGIRWDSGLARAFQYEKTQSRIGGTLWEYPLRYIENSPLFHADKIETPLLIIHSEEDHRCPVGQAEELFVALKKLDVETEMVRYPGCSHLMLGSGPSEYKIDYHTRVIEWFGARL